ncbi:MAG: hypothetical protein KF789_10010 [Bdellovibrionaceae bacterium]|nr:hypothetical protein [Pseudobdellovibrionaceae bacterium]
MNRQILSTLLCLLSFTASAQTRPFQSSEKFEYVAEKTDPLIGLIKTETFQGVVLRPDSSMESLRLIDDHLVPLEKAAVLNEKTCREALTRILGPSEGKDPVIKIAKVETFQVGSDPACEIEASDVKSGGPLLKRYRIAMRTYKGKIRAFVAQDTSAVALPDESEELRGFLKSLK